MESVCACVCVLVRLCILRLFEYVKCACVWPACVMRLRFTAVASLLALLRMNSEA